MDPSIKLKLMAAEDGKANTTLPSPLAISHLISLPADYSQLINQLSTFLYDFELVQFLCVGPLLNVTSVVMH